MQSYDSALHVRLIGSKLITQTRDQSLYEPPRGKTNNVVSEQVQHKSGCTVTEADLKLEILDLKRTGSILSV